MRLCSCTCADSIIVVYIVDGLLLVVVWPENKTETSRWKKPRTVVYHKK